MPYRRDGKNILKQTGTKWVVAQRCSSVANAEKALRLRRGIEHGMVVRKKR